MNSPLFPAPFSSNLKPVPLPPPTGCLSLAARKRFLAAVPRPVVVGLVVTVSRAGDRVGVGSRQFGASQSVLCFAAGCCQLTTLLRFGDWVLGIALPASSSSSVVGALRHQGGSNPVPRSLIKLQLGPASPGFAVLAAPAAACWAGRLHLLARSGPGFDCFAIPAVRVNSAVFRVRDDSAPVAVHRPLGPWPCSWPFCSGP